jgi:hypothetical protein
VLKFNHNGILWTLQKQSVLTEVNPKRRPNGLALRAVDGEENDLTWIDT